MEKKPGASLCRRKSVSFLEVDAKTENMLNSNSREVISDKLRNCGGNSSELSVFEREGTKNDESLSLNRISEHEDDVLSFNLEQSMNETTKADGRLGDSSASTKTETTKNSFTNSPILNSGRINNYTSKPSSINIKENMINSQNVSFTHTDARYKNSCVEDGMTDATNSAPSPGTALLNPMGLDKANRINSTNSTGKYILYD